MSLFLTHSNTCCCCCCCCCCCVAGRFYVCCCVVVSWCVSLFFFLFSSWCAFRASSTPNRTVTFRFSGVSSHVSCRAQSPFTSPNTTNSTFPTTPAYLLSFLVLRNKKQTPHNTNWTVLTCIPLITIFEFAIWNVRVDCVDLNNNNAHDLYTIQLISSLTIEIKFDSSPHVMALRNITRSMHLFGR